MSKIIEEMKEKAEKAVCENCAIKMLADNQPLDLVVRCSGLSVEDVKKIKEMNKL